MPDAKDCRRQRHQGGERCRRGQGQIGFHRSFLELADAADGEVLIACKPMMASFGVALVEAERRGGLPVVLDLDDLDVAFTPRELWAKNPSMADLRRPASAIYVSLLTKAAPAATA